MFTFDNSPGPTPGTPEYLFSSYNIVPSVTSRYNLGYSGDSAENTLIWNDLYVGNVYASYSVNSPLYNVTSDYRIKENIKALDDNFRVDYLKPITYMNKQTKKQDIGLIAHELQEIYPELVTGVKDGDDIQTVNYNGLIPILINEIKNLKDEMKTLKLKLEDKGIL